MRRGGVFTVSIVVVPRGGAVNGLEFKNSQKQSRKNYRKKYQNIGQNRGLLTRTFSTIRTRFFFFFFSREHLRDCIFPNNPTIALCTLPFKRHDLCPITDFTYVLEEVYMTPVSVKALVRWATGKRSTNRLPKLSLITLSPPLNSGILGLRMGPYVPTPKFFTFSGDPGRVIYQVLDMKKFTFL